MESKKSYQLSIKQIEDGIYDVYLGDLKLDFQVRRHPQITDDKVSDEEALDLAARFIVKLARTLAQSRKSMQKKKTQEVPSGGCVGIEQGNGV